MQLDAPGPGDNSSILAILAQPASMIQIFLISCLLGLGLSWNQPSTCCGRQCSACTGSSADYQEDIRGIRETLENNLMSIQDGIANLAASASSISMSLQQIVENGRTAPGSYSNPAKSCGDIPRGSSSGDYWIMTNKTDSPVQVYCDMERTSCSCNRGDGWARVANFDMTDPTQQCPDGFREIIRDMAPLRTCGRISSCSTAFYPTYGIEYSHVCGRVVGYQDGGPDAFAPFELDQNRTIDDLYVDGISLTYGHSPRQHIWTFVNAIDETEIGNCPCITPDIPYDSALPPFIGNDYFCDTGSRDRFQVDLFYADDPLWDGQGCGGASTCCEFNNPPWFCKQLSQPTTDDIELRLCANQDILDEDSPIEQVEIYIR